MSEEIRKEESADVENLAGEHNGSEGQKDYTAQGLQVLKGLEAVRKRPAKYIGDTTPKGLHHLVYEVVDNSIDEAMAGYCDTIHVTIGEGDIIKVVDNGRGIPVDMHKEEGKPCLLYTSDAADEE